MLRGMVFVDHMNFDIAVRSYYTSQGKKAPNLDYKKVFRSIVSRVPNVNFTKTIIFAPHPDDFLMQDSKLASYFKWITGLKSISYLDVVEGRYISRPVGEPSEMDINDHKTYYKVEKGTDINLAIHALSKAYSNAYDVAFIMSADTDYLNLYRQLKALGKLVVVVAVKGQNLYKIIPEVDDYIVLDDAFFSANERTSPAPSTAP